MSAKIVRKLSPASLLRVVVPSLMVGVWLGCRVPDPPVISSKSRGIVYDTSFESELKDGTALPLMQSFAQYVDTLAEPVAITHWGADSCRWEVFVATNRGRFAYSDDPQADARILDVPAYGVCAVTIPSRRRGTELKTESDRNTVKSASATATSGSASDGPIAKIDSTSIGESAFLDGVNDQIRHSRQRDLLVFVHGFNVSFDAAVARTAQIALDIPFNGAVVAYCWPSQGGVLSYSRDEVINAASVAPCTQFLKSLLAGVESGTRIHIVVHSMGNRIVMQSLNQLPTPRLGKNQHKPFANVVLCAPDVGESDFREWVPGVVAQSDRVSLYANASDSALIASKQLHAERRAGDSEKPIIIEDVETIDCSRIETSFMGHSYYGSNKDVLTDLFMLLKEDKPAAKRPHLTKKKSAAGPYWQFSDSAGMIIVTWHFDDRQSL
ncbi:MAG TPA: alpha/beta fold hydrolase [Planctomycetaceae bacterium]|nr:alpha/beta fold hydrolase [Planctomycetaceae bacterium]